jgi:hypothetical protein
MDVFSLDDTDMLRKVMSQLNPSICRLEHIPTTSFKTLFNCISEVQAIVNHSLFRGNFPIALITAKVKPLLKKSNLDSSALSNFGTISNLAFFCNILERLVFKQLNDFFKVPTIF